MPLRVTVADATVETVTDAEGYFRHPAPPRSDQLASPWTRGTVELAGEYRGLTDPHTTPLEVRVPGPDARFGIVSDVDDTILETGVQRVGQMIRQTFTGSALTRTPFPGAPELYRDLAAGREPGLLRLLEPVEPARLPVAFLRHREFPLGPVLLRDLLGTAAGREQKHGRIQEILDAAPRAAVRPHRRLRREGPGDLRRHRPGQPRPDPRGLHPRGAARPRRRPGREGHATWDHDVPFVLAADSDAVRRHATGLGLLGTSP